MKRLVLAGFAVLVLALAIVNYSRHTGVTWTVRNDQPAFTVPEACTATSLVPGETAWHCESSSPAPITKTQADHQFR